MIERKSRFEFGHIAAIAVALVLVPVWIAARGQRTLVSDPAVQCASCRDWNAPARPFKIFGDTYYVGPNGLSSILITSADGSILLDGALPQSAPVIVANIRTLGFDPATIRLIAGSHAHFDHVGGIHALQRLTGAIVAASGPAADALERGNLGPDDPQFALGPADTAFPPVAGVKRVADGDVLRIGSLVITAHLTPGHTTGGVTWTWRSCERSRCLEFVYADSLNAVSADGYRFTGDTSHPSVEASFRKSIALVEALPCDILLTLHTDAAQLLERQQRAARSAAGNPFVDPGACRAYAAGARAALDRRVLEERRAPEHATSHSFNRALGDRSGARAGW